MELQRHINDQFIDIQAHKIKSIITNLYNQVHEISEPDKSAL